MITRAIELRPAVVPEGGMRLITNISFEPRGMTVEYAEMSDVKSNGVSRTCALFVPHGDQYDDEIDAVIEAGLALLDDVLEDLPQLPMRELIVDDDDERGMGE